MAGLTAKERKSLQDSASRASGQLCNRLVGLETEYAALLSPLHHGSDTLPPGKCVYDSLTRQLRATHLSAAGLNDPDQFFFANGAVVSFECQATLQDEPGGLIEVATPEVRLPSDLLATQRAIDNMMEQAAECCDLDGEVHILKNSSDGKGHQYGCQENYEAVVARGAWLGIYRTMVCLLWITQIICSLLAAPLMGVIIGGTFVQLWARRHRQIRARKKRWEPLLQPGASYDSNEDSIELDDEFPMPLDDEPTPDAAKLFNSLPTWFSAPVIWMIQVTQAPIAWQVRFIGRHVAFREQRRILTTFLISRLTLCGTGDLDSSGRFALSPKAMVTDRISDLGGYRGERPIFVFGHWFSQLCGKSVDSWWQTRRLFCSRQRLQIGLSDSNMSEAAEFVKVGATSLMLDLIEAGEGGGLPIIKRPLYALYRIASDWNLVRRVPTTAGEMSAVDIQKAYWSRADRFVRNTSANIRGESEKVLSEWKSLIDASARFRADARDTRSSLCKLDWLTKRWLIDRQGSDAAWESRKKIDLRYHELSGDGYYRQLSGGLLNESLAGSDQRRLREMAPPSGSPAARRSWTIREFSTGGGRLNVGWSHADVETGRDRHRIRFDNHVY